MIESKPCHECIQELNKKIAINLDEIISHRDKCRKCQGCERLSKIKKAADEIEKG